MSIEKGTRVEVFGGDGSGPPRLGTYVGDVTVYAFFQDGALKSMKDAEQAPTDLPPGVEVMPIPGNPKIQMDDGSVCYGCQVWWREAPSAVPLD